MASTRSWLPRAAAPENPSWYYNLIGRPDEVMIQDGPAPRSVTVRQLAGKERAQWWERAVEAYPPYAQYQQKTDREIPVLIATPTGDNRSS